MTEAAALPGQPRGGVLSGPATARAVNVLAPNASAMTLDGTNTWIVSEPDSELAVVIDPGPLDDVHLEHVIAVAEAAGEARRPDPSHPWASRSRGGCRPVRRADPDRRAGPRS